MKTISHFFVILMLLMACASAQESLRIEYTKTESGYVCHISNISDKDMLIKNLKNRIGAMFSIPEDPFVRGKEWTYLRSKGSGLTSDRIAFRFSDTKTRNNIMFKVPSAVNLQTAFYDRVQGKKGKWKSVEYKVAQKADK